MTAHRHITLIGIVGAFMAGVFQFGGQGGQALVARLLPPSALILLLLGGCVTIYDAMIRHRARAVVLEMSRILKAPDNPKDHHKRGVFPSLFRCFDEDFFFFSQILILNALTALPLVMKVNLCGVPKLSFGIEGVFAYGVAAAFFASLWFATRRAYEHWGPANYWFPSA